MDDAPPLADVPPADVIDDQHNDDSDDEWSDDDDDFFDSDEEFELRDNQEPNVSKTWKRCQLPVGSTNVTWVVDNVAEAVASGKKIRSEKFQTGVDKESWLTWWMSLQFVGDPLRQRLDYAKLTVTKCPSSRTVLAAIDVHVVAADGHHVIRRAGGDRRCAEFEWIRSREAYSVDRFVATRDLARETSAAAGLVDDRGRLSIDCNITWLPGNDVASSIDDTTPTVPDEADLDYEPLIEEFYVGRCWESNGEPMSRETFADVELVAADGTAFSAHRAVLDARSSVFAAMLAETDVGRRSTEAAVDGGPEVVVLRVPDLDRNTVDAMLDCIYGIADARPTAGADFSPMLIDALLRASVDYDIPCLRTECKRRVIEGLRIETVADFMALIERYRLAAPGDPLHRAALRMLRLNMPEVISTAGYQRLRLQCPSLVDDLVVRGSNMLKRPSDADSDASTPAKRRKIR